ncbi:MAG TPA: hypothetical protein VN920_02505, partial [Pyrinomonadaceae bacterium]|nr:hypothetical protein [Pyrinomonadaceae bacterium]
FVVGALAYKSELQGPFLVQIFLAALLIRLLVGSIIFNFHGQAFFGGDAFTYDWLGYEQMRAWGGNQYSKSLIQAFFMKAGAPWGMVYLVGGIYQLTGRNMLAVQFFDAVLGAATAPLIFHCGYLVTSNIKVARLAAQGVAFMPSLVLWSSQELKDGPIMFFLALSIFATLKLGQKFTVRYLVALIGALLCVLAFRFYVFYMLLVAIVGAFLIGMRPVTVHSLSRQLVVVVLVGLSLTYFGVTRSATEHFESFGSLQAVNLSRSDQAQSAQSSFAKGADVSTPGGALLTIPAGLANLLFAPFPWQLTSLRQAITIPEMLVWWASFPMLILGLWYSIKYRLRQVFPMLLFTLMLSVAYSVFLGNVGNAYRERAQLLIFYFIFVAVGYVLMRERHEMSAASASLHSNEEEFEKRTVPAASQYHLQRPL